MCSISTQSQSLYRLKVGTLVIAWILKQNSFWMIVLRELDLIWSIFKSAHRVFSLVSGTLMSFIIKSLITELNVFKAVRSCNAFHSSQNCWMVKMNSDVNSHWNSFSSFQDKKETSLPHFQWINKHWKLPKMKFVWEGPNFTKKYE